MNRPVKTIVNFRINQFLKKLSLSCVVAEVIFDNNTNGILRLTMDEWSIVKDEELNYEIDNMPTALLA